MPIHHSRGNPGAGRRCTAAGFAIALAAFAAAGPAPARGQTLSLIRDTEIENLLKDYARPIFKAAGIGQGNIGIRIVKSDIFNAFVLDASNVYIHTGALQQSETPNQIIGVIAHESGHIAGGHLAQLRERIARDQTKSLLIKLLGIGMMVAGAAGGGGSGTAGAGAGVMMGGDEILMRSLLADRRAQEASADQAGLKYLTITRQSGKGMLETFERFAQQEYISASGATQDVFVRSHPVAADRLAQLRDLVAKSPYVNQKDSPQLQVRHDLMRAKLAGYLERPTIVFNRYPSKDQSLAARYARAIAKFFQSGFDAAAPEVEALIREHPENAYFHELKADFLMRTGKTQAAIAPLRTSLKLAGDAPLIKVRLAQALMVGDDPRAVEEAIDLSRKALIEDPTAEAYRILANGLYKKGQQPQADLAIAEAYFLEGDVKQAQIFAKRAQMRLPNGSPESIRAGDIVNYKIRT
jgi:predicted Zn-dependent protease